MLMRAALRQVCRFLAVLLLGGLAAGALVRLAPGFGIDEREMDARYSEDGLRAIRAERAGERNILVFYASFLGGMLRGEFGFSRALNRPVSELLADRIPVTARSAGWGLLAAWGLALALALPGPGRASAAYGIATTFLSGALLSLPSAVIALLFLYAGGAVEWAIAAVIFPRVFRYIRNLFLQTWTSAHIVTARARGLRPARILFFHVLPSAAPQLFALAGVSVSLAFGAAIPIEVICDSAGIGQLAWQAAMARDLPLLVCLTLLVTLVTLAANAVSDLAISAWSPAHE
jgi:peptide/nickel transport system permease protein